MPSPNSPAPTTVDYSLVVCTYNRATDLREMLESALRLETEGRFSYEIVVVDNNSTDDTRGVVESLLPASQGRLRYFFEARQGKSFALNTALEAVHGGVFTIADDDFLLPPDWLLRIDAAFRRHPDAAYVSGKVLPQWLGEPPAWLSPEHWSPLALADYGDEKFYADASRRVCLLACSFRVEPVRAVGGYDVRLGVSGSRTGGTEDLDIQERLWAAGHRGLYVPDIAFLHKVAASRLTRRYHRRWHRHHGLSYAQMEADKASLDRRAPGFLAYYLKELAVGVVRSVALRLRGRQAEAFRHEARAWFASGYVAGWVARRLPLPAR